LDARGKDTTIGGESGSLAIIASSSPDLPKSASDGIPRANPLGAIVLKQQIVDCHARLWEERSETPALQRHPNRTGINRE
jgi:hypothetical protein